MTKPDPATASRVGEATVGPVHSDPDFSIVTVTFIDIDTKLAVMCGLEESKVFFKYDSARVLPEAKERLDRIAACAKDGAAKGKQLLIVGRADPVGSDEYNKELGMSRADAVRDYLSRQGVAAPRVETVSKGEAAADPSAPGEWPYDRRVTVRLQEG